MGKGTVTTVAIGLSLKHRENKSGKGDSMQCLAEVCMYCSGVMGSQQLNQVQNHRMVKSNHQLSTTTTFTIKSGPLLPQAGRFGLAVQHHSCGTRALITTASVILRDCCTLSSPESSSGLSYYSFVLIRMNSLGKKNIYQFCKSRFWNL